MIFYLKKFSLKDKCYEIIFHDNFLFYDVHVTIFYVILNNQTRSKNVLRNIFMFNKSFNDVYDKNSNLLLLYIVIYV